MARPVKNYCDYFPHDRDMRNHRKVKAIRNKFGLSGYAIWVMLLEYLTGIDGNTFEYSDTEFELMAGDFGATVTEIRDVVDYCIKLEMIFLKDGFINSDSLDENLQPVYEKRNLAKSLSAKQLRLNGKFVSETPDDSGVTVAEMPQSKVEYSKVNKIKKDKDTKPLSFENSKWFDKEFWNSELPDWIQEKRDHYFNAALNWSNKGNKFKNWVLAVKAWDRKSEFKPTVNRSNGNWPTEDYKPIKSGDVHPVNQDYKPIKSQ